MKIKVFKNAELPEIVEKEVYLKLEDNGLSNHIGVVLVDKHGGLIQSPYILAFSIDPKTNKIVFYRNVFVNSEFVETVEPHWAIKEI